MEEIHDKIVANLKEVYDPEIPVNIYDLGLIYNIDIDTLSWFLFLPGSFFLLLLLFLVPPFSCTSRTRS